jgi:hypothetical protein
MASYAILSVAAVGGRDRTSLGSKLPPSIGAPSRCPFFIQRYGVSRSVIVSIRGARNYRQYTKYLKRGIRGFSRITPEQINLIRAMPESNRTVGLALGLASSSVSRYRRPDRLAFRTSFVTRPALPKNRKRDRREIAKRFDASQASVFRIVRTRRRRLPPCFVLAVESPPSGHPTAC